MKTLPMNDLYNIKAFLIQTKTRTTLDHEISSKRPISFDFFAYPTNYNKCWMSFASYNSSSARKIQTNFGISLLYGNKYRIKAKLADFRSPKVSISSVLPLPGNPRCFVKFSPRTEEQDNVFALIGFTDEIDKFKITSALLIQNKYHILSKIGFQPWKGLFLNSFVNYDISNRRIVDYAGMIGYEYRNWEFFLRQTYQDSHYNSNLESTSIALGCCYKYDSRLTLAMWLRSQQASKDVKSVKEKVVFGGRYQIDDKSYLKVKANDNLGYSMLYKLLCNDKFTLAARFTNSFKKNVPWSDAVGLRIRYHLH